MLIYKITCTKNKKYYIGQTSKELEERIYNHFWFLKNTCHWNPYLQNSWNKHGEESFEFEVIEKCNSIEELNEREIYWIEKLDALAPNNFNILEGGNKPPTFKEHTEESRRKLVDSQGKIIHKYDLEGNYLESFYGIKKAARENGINYQTITKCLNDSNKTSGGFQWSTKKVKNIGEVKYNYSNCGKYKTRKVYQLDKNDNIINKYKSLTKAAKETNTNRTGISCCLSGLYNTSNGYKWKYVDS